ncbi:putative phage protein (TIGR02218 family) [Desulfobaculum xiamenense]|uniref:Putative phage protein (TIGR02218 family) n=1 Tax=Desulfobaculum xiamenense TaxID=995050 RepID=A0A846QH34_9BACT|nr:phage BR0599 family protein [Desulfobaculum xiamenense]NJB66430.1 putative phage protein (TIGR02218 family) [Desulfobaculum xiamenense]
MIELYRFVCGASRWLYTSADAPVTHDGETYLPAPLERGDIRRTADATQAQIEIEAAHSLPLARQFVAAPPPGRILAEVLRGEGETYAVVWTGVVGGVQFDGLTCRIACATHADGLEGGGAARRLTRGCSHALYGAGCGVSRAGWKLSAVVAAVEGAVLRAPEFATRPDGWLTGGELAAGDQRRMIVAHAGEAVTLTGGIPGLKPGAGVSACAGCDHTLATCRDKFHNTVKFGGFPWLPQTNPFTGSVV